MARCHAAAVLLACSLHSDATPPSPLEIPFAPAPVSINGDLSEWQGAATLTLFKDNGRGERDNAAEVRLLCDTANLYVAFKVSDTELRASQVRDSSSLWYDDAVAVFLDTRHDASDRVEIISTEEFERRGGVTWSEGRRAYLEDDDYNLMVNARGSIAAFKGRDLDPECPGWRADIVRAVVCTGTLNEPSDIDSGYVVEAAIPWKVVGVEPRSGTVIGVDFAFNDADADGNRHSADWCDIRPFSQPHLWGDLILPEMSVANRPPGRLALALGAAVLLCATAVVGLKMRLRRARPGRESGQRTLPHAEAVQRIEAYLAEHYASENTSVESAANYLGLSVRYFQKILKRAGKPTFSRMLSEMRIQKAEQLLRNTDRTISEICFEVGFKRPDAFARLFRKHRGFSPSEFREKTDS